MSNEITVVEIMEKARSGRSTIEVSPNWLDRVACRIAMLEAKSVSDDRFLADQKEWNELATKAINEGTERIAELTQECDVLRGMMKAMAVADEARGEVVTLGNGSLCEFTDGKLWIGVREEGGCSEVWRVSSYGADDIRKINDLIAGSSVKEHVAPARQGVN